MFNYETRNDIAVLNFYVKLQLNTTLYKLYPAIYIKHNYIAEVEKYF